MAGCDFTPDFRDLDPELEEPGVDGGCGGPGILCDVSGAAGEPGSDGDGGPAKSARHNLPVDVAMAPLTQPQTGEIYIVDWLNHSIRRIAPDGVISTYAGTGRQGGDTSGDADLVSLNSPTDFTVGPDGLFYIAGWQTCAVMRVDPVTHLLTSPIGSDPGFSGDGGPAELAMLDLPSSIAFDPDGNMYVADQVNQRIRKIDSQGIITTYAGTTRGFLDDDKESAQFAFPDRPNPAPGGKISMNTHDWVMYIADTENHRIRRINFFTGLVTTVAGTGEPGYAGDGANARMAQLNAPTDVIFREDHHVYIADTGNNVIRKIDPFGTITTLVGTGEAGASPDGTAATEAMLNRPMGIFYDEVTYNLYIADTYNHQIKRVYDR